MLTGAGAFGALAERLTKCGEQVHVEEIEAEAPDDLSAHFDRLALRARELVAGLEAL